MRNTRKHKYSFSLHNGIPYSLIIQHKKNGNYYVYKSSYRENGKVRSKYVYIGNEEAALKILTDFNSKKPANERLLSFSGEKILAKVLEMLDFNNTINKAIQRDTKLDADRFVEMVVVERALKTFSKWGLAAIAHGKSVFSLDPSIPGRKFTEANIYHYIDYLHPHLDAIQEVLVENLLHIGVIGGEIRIRRQEIGRTQAVNDGVKGDRRVVIRKAIPLHAEI